MIYHRSCIIVWSSVGRHLLCRRMFPRIIIHQKSTATSVNQEDFLRVKNLELSSCYIRYGCPPPGVSLSALKKIFQVDEVRLFLDHFSLKTGTVNCFLQHREQYGAYR